jgi:pimeloyl-ACP methyl ester carboxylesterase
MVCQIKIKGGGLMSRYKKAFALLAGVLGFLALALFGLSACAPADADTILAQVRPLSACQDGVQASGAIYRICMPEGIPWNGELMVFAHGYMAYNRPIEIPEDQLVFGGVSVTTTVTSLGYAFAMSSYSTNGLAMREGIADLVDVVDLFAAQHGAPSRVYLVGPSEGGIMTALAIEKYPDRFDGGLAACGPVGGLPAQVNFMGDFRVVFDYYFPDLLPGEAISIPQSLIDNWETHYATVVYPTISDPASAYSMTQLFAVTGAAYDPADPATAYTTTQGLLWYSVFATNDARQKLGGQPFDNQGRAYSGSDDDTALNAGVRRYAADPAALAAMEADYQTFGTLKRPVVTVHTTLDEIIPYWHETLYRDKIVANGREALHANYPVPRYGHCNFQQLEVVAAFSQLVQMVESQPRYRVFVPVAFGP